MRQEGDEDFAEGLNGSIARAVKLVLEPFSLQDGEDKLYLKLFPFKTLLQFLLHEEATESKSRNECLDNILHVSYLEGRIRRKLEYCQTSGLKWCRFIDAVVLLF